MGKKGILLPANRIGCKNLQKKEFPKDETHKMHLAASPYRTILDFSAHRLLQVFGHVLMYKKREKLFLA